jgi:enterochelin esterase family protein
MVTVLNNLIHCNKIQPIVVVFVDQRNPINRAENRRMRDLAMNSNYLNFYLDELVPEIERNYTVEKDAAQRGIMGTSMGGLNAAYFSFTRPDIFGLSAIQSPAFSYRNEIFTTCENAENPPLKIFLSAGSIYDAIEGAEKMKGILEQNLCTFQFVEMNQSHSWGQWRSLLDDILVYFFPVSN